MFYKTVFLRKEKKRMGLLIIEFHKTEFSELCARNSPLLQIFCTDLWTKLQFCGIVWYKVLDGARSMVLLTKI